MALVHLLKDHVVGDPRIETVNLGGGNIWEEEWEESKHPPFEVSSVRKGGTKTEFSHP